jgi:DNA mismatch endonuclease, patch repair protein
MQGNRQKDTGPERALRTELHARGLRFRKNRRITLGTGRKVNIDIVFVSRRLAVFVDGCYWHCCPDHGRVPTGNQTYWSAKLERNQKRDLEVSAELTAEGWHVIRVWEHCPPQEAAEQVLAVIATLDSVSHPPQPVGAGEIDPLGPSAHVA